ncbi:hypothetical protein Mycch_0166 [Mycolicibacterium chubuense NBB4]|uniref:Uncharacterized protein n=1 Tax=Mycolicibacterium chubuense (strain NBB4) TaxID=710421 RepID=I4BCI5_MYCCN|nr:hypothetical protein [Mycolicibacterium chubuense]AFM14992.1 hypothetical protein Mycch_0166 [Mycolicibacterium chubuense NBB4]
MTRVVVSGVCLLIGVQVLAFAALDRPVVVAVTGAGLALVVIALRRCLVHDTDEVEDAATGDAATAMGRWVTRTETMISWSESTRSDWDRRLRPMLARQFELAAVHRKVKDRSVFDTTGRMLFGDELWQWVDPENVSRTGGQEPGPGRWTLDEILRRLERL